MDLELEASTAPSSSLRSPPLRRLSRPGHAAPPRVLGSAWRRGRWAEGARELMCVTVCLDMCVQDRTGLLCFLVAQDLRSKTR